MKFSGIALYNNPGMKYLLQPRYRWLRHTLYIGIIFLFWFAFAYKSFAEGFIETLKVIIYALSYVTIVYFNFLVLMPRLLYRNKVWVYLLATYGSFLIGYALQQLIYPDEWKSLHTWPTTFDLIRDMTINAITFFMFCGIGWAFSMFKMWLTDEKRINELETEHLKAELGNLKNQVNPHFLFNAFNNLYVTSVTEAQKVPAMIMNLADLMRYQLSECTKEKVPLESEIEYIKNFLAIEKVRKEHADIQFLVTGDTTGIHLQPLLFVPLVENAFKHGLGKVDKGYVFISLSTHNGHQLHLRVENNKGAIATSGHGIGLKNLQKRLELGYPGRFRLDIEDTPESYTVNLELQLE